MVPDHTNQRGRQGEVKPFQINHDLKDNALIEDHTLLDVSHLSLFLNFKKTFYECETPSFGLRPFCASTFSFARFAFRPVSCPCRCRVSSLLFLLSSGPGCGGNQCVTAHVNELDMSGRANLAKT